MSVLRLPSLPASAGKQQWGNLPGAALSLTIAEAASGAGRFTLVLTEGSQSAERLQEEGPQPIWLTSRGNFAPQHARAQGVERARLNVLAGVEAVHKVGTGRPRICPF